MKRATWITLALALLLVFSVAPVAQAQTDQDRIWYEEEIWVECANGGNGEYVRFSGYMHATFRQTFDNAGGVHVKFQVNPQGISGYGLTTGNQYQGTGVTQEQFNIKIGEETTFVSNYNLIGHGKAPDMRVHENFHITVNANGTVTAFVDNINLECQ